MYTPSSVSKRLILVPILAMVAIQLFFIRNASSLNMTNAYLNHKCLVSQGKYQPGSVYEKNLNVVIRKISKGYFSSGFDQLSHGVGPDFASVILQCRGDSYGPKCRSCYATALSKLRRKCPRYRGGIIWYDQCLLEISGIDTRAKVDYDNNFCMSNAKNVSSNQNTFNMKWMSFLDNLTGIAIDQRTLYAAGERRFGTEMVYGMVQCTKDLPVKACVECVGYIHVHFFKCFGGKQGARVVGRSCNFRYEIYPFISTKTGTTYLKS